MALATGTRLGAYEILSLLGAGGMGEVYRARDAKLNRDVALKVLPEAFTADPDRLARFKREAQVLASLNHPHIGAIYGLEESDGVRALVLELVEGPTLADRIALGPIPPDEALPIAKQIADALEGAHEAGIGDAGSESVLVWVDRNGREEPISAPARAYAWPRLSPDGTRVAVEVNDQDRDIWIWDVRRHGLTRFTLGATVERSPVWTPDGQRLVFSSDREGSRNLFWQSADGTGPVARLTNTANLKEPFSVSPDGKRLVFGEQVQRFDLWALALDDEPRPQLLLQTRFGDRDGEISPDGRWLAYSSDESGQFEIYVRPFPKVSEQRFQISSNGGAGAVWARSRPELFYQTPAGNLISVPIKTGVAFFAGSPSKVFDGTQYVSSRLGRMYDVSPDGQRFLMLKPDASSKHTAASASLVVVINWFEELRARVPAK